MMTLPVAERRFHIAVKLRKFFVEIAIAQFPKERRWFVLTNRFRRDHVDSTVVVDRPNDGVLQVPRESHFAQVICAILRIEFVGINVRFREEKRFSLLFVVRTGDENSRQISIVGFVGARRGFPLAHVDQISPEQSSVERVKCSIRMQKGGVDHQAAARMRFIRRRRCAGASRWYENFTRG